MGLYAHALKFSAKIQKQHYFTKITALYKENNL